MPPRLQVKEIATTRWPVMTSWQPPTLQEEPNVLFETWVQCHQNILGTSIEETSLHEHTFAHAEKTSQGIAQHTEETRKQAISGRLTGAIG